jgi:hypothetical protein
VSAQPENQQPEAAGSYENHFSLEEEPQEFIAFQEGVVMALRLVGHTGKRHFVSDEAYCAIPENQLKQLAVDQAWVAIEAMKRIGDPELDAKAKALMDSTGEMPHTTMIRQPEHRDFNS